MPPWRAVIVSFRFRRLDVEPLAQSAINRVILPYPPACSGCRLGRVGRRRLIGCLGRGAQGGVAAG